MAGYSGKPLIKKLGIKEGFRVALVDAPKGFKQELGALPNKTKFMPCVIKSLDLILVFVNSEQN